MRLQRTIDLARIRSHAHERHLMPQVQVAQHMKCAQIPATGEWVQRAGFDP
jgi:hypothetical protein